MIYFFYRIIWFLGNTNLENNGPNNKLIWVSNNNKKEEIKNENFKSC